MRKYFNLASVWYFLSFLIIKGIKTRRLISSLTQVISQLSAEIASVIDKIIVIVNKILEGCKKIAI